MISAVVIKFPVILTGGRAMGTDHDMFMRMLEDLHEGKELPPIEPAATVPVLTGEPGDQLNQLVGMAIERLHELLAIAPRLLDERQVRLQITAALSILQTQVKVDESRLKRRKLDVLPRLIELIKEERAKQANGALVIEGEPVINGAASIPINEKKPVKSPESPTRDTPARSNEHLPPTRTAPSHGQTRPPPTLPWDEPMPLKP
jgi:hypothetical protein